MGREMDRIHKYLRLDGFCQFHNAANINMRTGSIGCERYSDQSGSFTDQRLQIFQIERTDLLAYLPGLNRDPAFGRS